PEGLASGVGPTAPPTIGSRPARTAAAATGRRTSLARDRRCPLSAPGCRPARAPAASASSYQKNHGSSARPTGGSPSHGDPPAWRPAGGSACVTGYAPHLAHPVGARGGDQRPGGDQADP